ncbi:hypothetical protein ALC57_04031, partial [Trachymyrmex cornetzi]
RQGRERLGVIKWKEEKGIECMKELEERIREVLENRDNERGKEWKERGWWDRECKEKKKGVRRVLREWRKGKGGGEVYRKEKNKYKELCEAKKKEDNERWERKVEGAKEEKQVWDIVNGERKRWRGINKGIEMQEWEVYFKDLLGGVEGRVIWGKGERRGQGRERELSREELRKVTRNLTDGKAMGVDRIPNEVWKYGGGENIEEEGGSLAHVCWEEVSGNIGKGEKLEGWEKERRQYFEDRGVEVGSWQRGELEGGVNFEDLLERDRVMQKEERWEKIRESRFNRWYGWVKGKGVPAYLGNGWGEGRWRRVARFRLGNEVRDGRYWEGEEERKCRFCGNGGGNMGARVGRM